MPTELQSLAKIFNNRLFRIPDYQRGFAWGERRLADFWSDLLRVGLDRTHYCGQLTLEKAPEESWQQWTGDTWLMEDAGYDPHFVVDGQQRLTTAVILLQCLLEGLPEDQLLAGQSVKECASAIWQNPKVFWQAVSSDTPGTTRAMSSSAHKFWGFPQTSIMVSARFTPLISQQPATSSVHPFRKRTEHHGNDYSRH